MERIADQEYLLKEQYAGPRNLPARAGLHGRFSANPCPWHRWVFDHLEVPADGSVLELGCGMGLLWRENRDRIPAGWRIVLTDLSPGMLDEAQKTCSRIGPGFRFQVVDAKAIPFPNGSFDAVIANHMLYHVPDLDKALSEIARVLKPQGRLYAATNGRAHMQEVAEIIAQVQPRSVDTPSGFPLENGAERLRRHFGKVVLDRHEDRLLVTESAPLCDYIYSMPTGAAMTGPQRAQLEKLIETRLRQDGTIIILKDSGLFTGTEKKA